MKEIRKIKIKAILTEDFSRPFPGCYYSVDTSDGSEGYVIKVNAASSPEEQERVFLTQCLLIWRHDAVDKEIDLDLIKNIREGFNIRIKKHFLKHRK